MKRFGPWLLAVWLSLFAGPLAFAGKPVAVQIEKKYDWGTLTLSAGEANKVHIGESDLIIFNTNVRADLHLSDGRRMLIATGRLEFDPKTGDFNASSWPFLYYFRTEENSGTFSANSEGDAIQFHGGQMRVKSSPKTDQPPPEIVKLRERQLAELKERL